MFKTKPWSHFNHFELNKNRFENINKRRGIVFDLDRMDVDENNICTDHFSVGGPGTILTTIHRVDRPDIPEVTILENSSNEIYLIDGMNVLRGIQSWLYSSKQIQNAIERGIIPLIVNKIKMAQLKGQTPIIGIVLKPFEIHHQSEHISFSQIIRMIVREIENTITAFSCDPEIYVLTAFGFPRNMPKDKHAKLGFDDRLLYYLACKLSSDGYNVKIISNDKGRDWHTMRNCHVKYNVIKCRSNIMLIENNKIIEQQLFCDIPNVEHLNTMITGPDIIPFEMIRFGKNQDNILEFLN